MGSTTKRGYWFPAGNDTVALFPGQNELLFMKKLDTDMDTALKANRSTGVRDLASSLDSQVSSGTVRVARIGDTVTVSFESVKFDGDGSYGPIIRLPYGFRAMMTLRENLVSAEHGHQIATYTSGTVQCNRETVYEIRNTFTFLTADDWPSSLPGDPA